jgi:hypothetical protein
MKKRNEWEKEPQKVETLVAHYLVVNKIPMTIHIYPLQPWNSDTSHRPPCKAKTKSKY